MKNLDATHVLDMVVGGDPNAFSHDKHGNPVLDDSNANRSIGSQWVSTKDKNGMSRVDYLRDEVKKIQKNGLHNEKMNIELGRCKYDYD